MARRVRMTLAVDADLVDLAKQFAGLHHTSVAEELHRFARRGVEHMREERNAGATSPVGPNDHGRPS